MAHGFRYLPGFPIRIAKSAFNLRTRAERECAPKALHRNQIVHDRLTIGLAEQVVQGPNILRRKAIEAFLFIAKVANADASLGSICPYRVRYHRLYRLA